MRAFLRRLLGFERRKLETHREADDIGRAVLLWYLQGGGQSLEEKGNALIEAGRWCGFNCQLEMSNGQAIPQIDGEAEDLAVWKEFRAAIERCWPIGSWEAEHAAVVGVLLQFRRRLEDAR